MEPLSALDRNHCPASIGIAVRHRRNPHYAPELNPDELVWSHLKRTGPARTPLRKGEKLRDKIEAQLAAILNHPLIFST